MQAAAFAAILAIAAVAVPMLTAGKVGLQEASAQASVAAGSTIKVTGDASMSITPDQVMFSVSRQSQPQPDAIQALAEQEEYIAQITEAVTAVSEDTTVTVGQKYLNPFYSGPGQYPSDVTFSIYSTIAVHTSVDSLSPLAARSSKKGMDLRASTWTRYIQPGCWKQAASCSQRELCHQKQNLSKSR